MIFRFTEEEQAIIRNFEKRTREEHPNIAEVFENVIEDVKEEADGEELKVNLIENSENKQIADNLRNEFNALLAQMEQKRFEVLKTQSQILEDAMTTINEAIVFTYNFLQLPNLNNDEISNPIIVNGYKYKAYNLCSYIFKYGSKAFFDFAIDKKLDKINVLLDEKYTKEFLIEMALKNHFERLKEDKSGLKQLNELIDKILEKSKYINTIARNPKKEMVFDGNYSADMANALIQNGINTLSANELKLLRLAIAQTEIGETELYPYETTPAEIAKAFKVSASNLSRDLLTMAENIQSAHIKIKNGEKWLTAAWVKYCFYDEGKFLIQINDTLKPYLLDLKGCFSKIKMEEYFQYTSKHAIIIRELLETKMAGNYPSAAVTIEIPITLEELKERTNTKKKYKDYTRFKTKVLDKALEEINAVHINFHFTAIPYKNGRKIEGFNFLIESTANPNAQYKAIATHEEPKKTKRNTVKVISEPQGRQLTIKDLLGEDF